MTDAEKATTRVEATAEEYAVTVLRFNLSEVTDDNLGRKEVEHDGSRIGSNEPAGQDHLVFPAGICHGHRLSNWAPPVWPRLGALVCRRPRDRHRLGRAELLLLF